MSIITEPRVPPLRAGDHLTRTEFLRRWKAHPNIRLAELIGNVVYMTSPVSADHGLHGARLARADLGAWLGVYHEFSRGTASERDITSFLLEDTPQPDVNLRLLPEYGGGSWIEDGYLHGVPELVAEVCVSGASYDLNQKYRLYESAGIATWLWWRLNRKFAGTCLSAAATNFCRPTPADCGDHGLFPASGSTARRCWPATCGRFSIGCKLA